MQISLEGPISKETQNDLDEFYPKTIIKAGSELPSNDLLRGFVHALRQEHDGAIIGYSNIYIIDGTVTNPFQDTSRDSRSRQSRNSPPQRLLAPSNLPSSPDPSSHAPQSTNTSLLAHPIQHPTAHQRQLK